MRITHKNRPGLVQVKLRISDGLKRRLDREAKKRDDGSLSSEIAERLERSFSAPSLEKAVAAAVVKKLKMAGFARLKGRSTKGGKR
jgi:hypothetical protein